MSTIVYKGIRIHCEPGVNLLVHNDRIEVIDSAPNFHQKKIKKNLSTKTKSTGRTGSVSNFIRENFTKPGTKKEVRASTDHAIRSVFGRLGWSGKVKQIRSGLYDVTRVA